MPLVTLPHTPVVHSGPGSTAAPAQAAPAHHVSPLHSLFCLSSSTDLCTTEPQHRRCTRSTHCSRCPLLAPRYVHCHCASCMHVCISFVFPFTHNAGPARPSAPSVTEPPPRCALPAYTSLFMSLTPIVHHSPCRALPIPAQPMPPRTHHAALPATAHR